MAGLPKLLQDEQMSSFLTFKEAIKDCKLVDSRDVYILKWLTARQFDFEQAEKMLRQSLEWRKVNRIDDIVDHWQPPTVLVQYYPLGICGRDKLSCPVLINAFGRTDWKGILLSTTKRDFARYICYVSEITMKQMKKDSLESRKDISQQTFIIDMDQLSMREMAYKAIREVGIEVTKMSEANYPESLRKVFIINTPKIFTIVFNMIKPFLHQVTLDKIHVFGTEQNEWLPALLEEIDADQLPAYYGGSMTDPDGYPECSNKFNMGGQVPESFYANRDGKIKLDKSEMTLLTIFSRRKEQMEFNVTVPNSVLKWKFLTEGGDLEFHIYYLMPDGEKVDVVPAVRVDSHLVMEEGEIVCTRCCPYIVIFDNRFSYIRSKTLWYRIRLDTLITQPTHP